MKAVEKMEKELARTLFAFAGEEPGDLSFNQDEIITITRKDPCGWWEGISADGNRGEFPYNFVELIQEKDVEKMKTARFTGRISTNEDSSVDKIQRVTVVPVSGTTTFKIEAFLLRKTVTASKNMNDFRNLDADLKYMYPDFDKPLPPQWSDKHYENEQASENKAQVLQAYLQILPGVEETEFALITWLSPRESFRCSEEAKATVAKAQRSSSRNVGRNSYSEEAVKSLLLVRVEFTKAPKDAVELPLQEGTVIAIKNKNTESVGWWEGELSDGQIGLLPSNYVKELPEDEIKDVVKGFGLKVAPVSLKAPPKKAAANRKPKTENNFSLPSLEAFDMLLKEDFAMLADNKKFVTLTGGIKPRIGDVVTVEYVGYVWDCQKQRIIEFGSSDLPDSKGNVGPMHFKLGSGEMIQGIEKAMFHLMKGQSCRVVIRPKLGWGEVGDPPRVPPNCHLVYDVTLSDFGAERETSKTMSMIIGDRQKRPARSREILNVIDLEDQEL